MPFYECVFIARQDISTTQAEQLSDAMAAIITEHGGTVAKKEYWGLKNLAFRINKNRKGHYSLLAIDAPAPAVKEMERQLSINEDVLRYLTVRVDELEEGPSAMLQSRHRDREGGGRDRDGRFRDRDDRPRRDRPPFEGERERPAVEGEVR